MDTGSSLYDDADGRSPVIPLESGGNHWLCNRDEESLLDFIKSLVSMQPIAKENSINKTLDLPRLLCLCILVVSTDSFCFGDLTHVICGSFPRRPQYAWGSHRKILVGRQERGTTKIINQRNVRHLELGHNPMVIFRPGGHLRVPRKESLTGKLEFVPVLERRRRHLDHATGHGETRTEGTLGVDPGRCRTPPRLDRSGNDT